MLVPVAILRWIYAAGTFISALMRALLNFFDTTLKVSWAFLMYFFNQVPVH